MEFITIGVVAAALVLWMLSVRRRLAAMEENMKNAMNQIGVQLSSRFDALTALLDLTKEYAPQEVQTLRETIRSRRSPITAASPPKEVRWQDEVISEALVHIAAVAEAHPALKASESYAMYQKAVDSYETMVRTSRLIYNDSVTKFNREIRMFPTSLAAGVLGFRQREHLEAPEQTVGSGAPAASPAAPAADAVTELQRFKILVDQGIITEEEFAAKKRQFLGL